MKLETYWRERINFLIKLDVWISHGNPVGDDLPVFIGKISDPWHYDSEGYIGLGEKFAESLNQLSLKK